MIEIGDIRQASALYLDMVATYNKYMRGEGRTDNYARIIGDAFNLCKLGLPDPFKLLEPQSAAEKVKPEEAIEAIEDIQVVSEAEPAKPAEPAEQGRKGRKWFGGKESV